MPAACRLGDMSTGHDGFNPRPNSQGSANVFINGIAAHRVGDQWPPHKRPSSAPHPGVLAQGSPNVFVNGVALGRIGDAISCGDTVAQGSPNVFVNG